MGRIELPTSPLPRECSTTEPHGHDRRKLQRQKSLELSTYTLARYRATN